MKITYGDLVIAAEPLEVVDSAAGTDGVDGLLPKGERDVQVVKRPRAPFPSLYPRGNEVYTVPVTITPKAYESGGAAVLAMVLYLSQLPASGTLILEEDDVTVEFSNAAIKTVGAPYRIGVSFAADLVFLAVNPSEGS